MSCSKVLFQAMRPKIEYTAEELSSETHIDLSTVSYILKQLVSGGVVTVQPTGRYKRGKKFVTKQKALF